MKHRLASLSLLMGAAIGASQLTARAEPPALAIYGQLPAFESAALSPSGDKIAVTGMVGEQRRLLVVDRAGKPILTAPLGDAKIRNIYWIGDDRLLIYKSDTVNLGVGFTTEKAELSSAIVLPLDGKKSWTVFQNNRNIAGGVRGFYGVRQRAGKWYGYFGGITLDSDGKMDPWLKTTNPVLYEVDMDTGATRKIASRSNDGTDRTWIIGPDGRVAATFDYVSQSGSWSIRNSADQRIAEGKSKLAGADLVGLGNAGDTLLYSLTDDATGESRWFEVPLVGGTGKEVFANAGIESSFFDSRSRRFVGYAVSGDMPSYRFLDPYQQKVVEGTLKAFPENIARLVDWNDALDRLIVTTEGGKDPKDWWLVDIKTGQATPIGRSYLVPSAQVGPVKMVRYKAGDGAEIAGILTLPPGRDPKNLPVLIFPHGGPHQHDTLGFDWWAQAFAARGYAVLQPNFRGSTGYGYAFQRAGHGEWGRKMQTDISDGLAYLVREGIADPKRACIMGASYGGYAALAGVTLQQGLYRCAVSFAGIGDVARMALTNIEASGGDPTMRRSLKETMGSGRDLAAVSPARFVDKVTAPILLIHGKNDTVVPYDQSNDMAAALRRAGKTVEFVTLDGEDHWLSKSATRLAMLQSAVAFIEKHNPPDAPTGANPTTTASAAPQ